jgi:hypothetical protein
MTQTIQPSSETAKPNSSPPICGNCGASLSTRYCPQCGQHERGSRRLRLRDIAAHCTQALLDTESALPATLIGLCRNPGQLCLGYVHGKRKRYMNPFAYLLVAATLQIILSALLHGVGWLPRRADETGALPDDALTGLLFIAVLPLALLWMKLFARSGKNFAENYLLGVYLVGQIAWLELLLLPFPAITASDTVMAIAFPLVWLALTTWAGVIFYSMPWYSVLWRMFVSSVIAFVILGACTAAVTGVAELFQPAEVRA